MNNKSKIKVFQKYLNQIFVMVSCLFCSQVTMAADNMPKMFSSANANKAVLASDQKAVTSVNKAVLASDQKAVTSVNKAVLASDQKVATSASKAVLASGQKTATSSVSGLKNVSLNSNTKALTVSETPAKVSTSSASKTLSISDIRPGAVSDTPTVSSVFEAQKTPLATSNLRTLAVSDTKKASTLDNSKAASSSIAQKTLSTSNTKQSGAAVSSLFANSNDDINESKKSESVEFAGSEFELAQAPEYVGGVTFEADEEQLSALPLIKGIYELASEAQTMHNTKQQLPGMRKPFFEYEKMKNRHAQAIARLATSVLAARDYLASYYGKEKADEVWFGKGCHYKTTVLGQKCAPITGCKRPYDPTKFRPVASHNIICKNDVFSITDYAKIRGLYGEIVSAYKMAKAESASGSDITEDNFEESMKADVGTPVIDMNLSAIDSGDASSEQSGSEKSMSFLNSGKSISEDDLSAMGGGIEENPEKTAESEASMREQNLVRWQIGSAFAEKIGQDMAGGGQLYGVPQAVYPLWEDEKRVYNQYLKEKYKNMELYFSSSDFNLVDFDIAKILNDTLTVNEDYISSYRASLVAQELEDSEIKKKVAALREDLEEEKDALKAQNLNDILAARQKFEQSLYKGTISALKTRQENEISQLEEQVKVDVSAAKTALQQKYNEIDEIMERLNQNKDEYQKKLREQEDAKSMANSQDRSVALEDKKLKKDPNYVSGFKNEAIETKIKNLQIVVNLQPQIDSLKKQIDEDQNKVKKLKAEVVVMGVREALIKKAYIKNAVLMESRHHQEMKEALEARGSDVVVPKVFMAVALATVSPSVQSMLEDAGNLREEFQALAKAEVKSTYQEISGYADLYKPQTYPKISARHQKMIENIKKLQQTAAFHSLTKFVFGNVVFGLPGFPIFDCPDCEKEDEDYYVGFEGTKRDFMAPKRMAVSYTPPLRELLHFDAVDLDSINKYEPENGEITYMCPPFGCPSSLNPRTTKSEFLKLGQKLPNIWTRILMPRGFVERDIDVEDILMDGATPSCGEGFMTSACPSSQVENLSRAFLDAKGERAVPHVGELAVFFKYDNGLTFTDAIMDLYDQSENIEENFEGDDNPSEEQINEYVNLIHDFERRFLARTQMGDVLQFVDMEQTYQKGVDQLKANIDETRRTIDEFIEKLACQVTRKDTDYLRPGEETSRIVSSEFIADDETFEAVAQCLDEGKNKYIQGALDLQKELPVLSDEIKGLKEKSDDMLLCMQKDNEELVVLSDNTSPSTELDEQIKSERVNGEVTGKYREEGNKKANKDQAIPLPYRAYFGPGDPYIP